MDNTLQKDPYKAANLTISKMMLESEKSKDKTPVITFKEYIKILGNLADEFRKRSK